MRTNGNGLQPHQVSLAAPPPPPLSNAHVLRKRMTQMQQDAETLVGVAQLIANRLAQVLACGGASSVQQQMAFITGAVARMQKDWGVIEHLQAQGGTVKKPPPP